MRVMMVMTIIATTIIITIIITIMTIITTIITIIITITTTMMIVAAMAKSIGTGFGAWPSLALLVSVSAHVVPVLILKKATTSIVLVDQKQRQL